MRNKSLSFSTNQRRIKQIWGLLLLTDLSQDTGEPDANHHTTHGGRPSHGCPHLWARGGPTRMVLLVVAILVHPVWGYTWALEVVAPGHTYVPGVAPSCAANRSVADRPCWCRSATVAQIGHGGADRPHGPEMAIVVQITHAGASNPPCWCSNQWRP